jgi:enoyl-CoA hydratase/carnithine racemase
MLLSLEQALEPLSDDDAVRVVVLRLVRLVGVSRAPELSSTAKTFSGSLAAYQDLYRAALDCGLTDGLSYEARTQYPIAETAGRVEQFR